jgi:DNA-binding NarL/FixJ family response regulator
MPIRILAVDDHALLREGIAALLADQQDMKIVAEASNGREAIEQFRTHNPTSRSWTCKCRTRTVSMP